MISKGVVRAAAVAVATVALGASLPLIVAAPARAGTLWMWACNQNSKFSADWQSSGNSGGYDSGSACPGTALTLSAFSTSASGQRGWWQSVAPPGIAIVHAWIPHQDQVISYGVNDGQLYGGGYFWQGGGAGFADYQYTYNSPNFFSPYFGVQLVCGKSSCNPNGLHPAGLYVENIQLEGEEDQGPTITDSSNDLWNAHGWVRARWPVSVQASDPSGICAMSVQVAGDLLNGPSATPDQSRWQQCPNPQGWPTTIDTASYPNGPVNLSLQASNAAYDYAVHAPVSSSVSKTIYVDNQLVTLSLSGPTDAPSTAGTQYVSATAAAGPSGVAGIECSVDGAPYQWRSGASAQIPVQGIGRHEVFCYAQNNAIDGTTGSPGTSATQSWSLSIRQPTVVSASFANVVGKLRCVRRIERVRVPGRWVKVRRRGRRVRVRRRAHVRKVLVVRCHPRIVRRRVRVHGHWRIVSVPVFPRVVSKSAERVRFGRPATVSGWLGLSDGTALAAQTVRVVTAPENGSGRFTQAAVARTAANGTWTAVVPRGPSRLIEAVYDGSAAMEPAHSVDVRLSVPAKIRLRIGPDHVAWGRRIVIGGRVLGGYIPADETAVSQLLRLRIGVAGVSQTAGIPNVKRDGRFRTSYCFSTGRGVVHYWFSVSTLTETNFAFSHGSSRRVSVIVGPSNARRPCR